MKKLELDRGLHALVDDEDYEELRKYKWHAAINKSGNAYAKTNVTVNGKYLCVSMQNMIMEEDWIDHIDNDGLNNQKYNLRKCTPKQNAANRPIRSKSGYKGIKKIGEQYQVKVNKIKIGMFNCLEDAIVAYNIAALKEWGIFAVLNTYKPSTYNPNGKYSEFKETKDDKGIRPYIPSNYRLFVETHLAGDCKSKNCSQLSCKMKL